MVRHLTMRGDAVRNKQGSSGCGCGAFPRSSFCSWRGAFAESRPPVVYVIPVEGVIDLGSPPLSSEC